MLRLRKDHWSEGAAQVAAEQGLQAPSFDQAAAAYSRAVGGSVSGDSVRRITEAFGERVAQGRQGEVERAFAIDPAAEPAQGPCLPMVEPIEERGNVSSDGTMILVRGEGWKEVKLTVISQVAVQPADKRSSQEGRRAEDPLVTLSTHSCQAGLWEADTMARYQYAEGLRRGLEHCRILTSVNDAAAWIERITSENFPQAVQIVDWTHASQYVWLVAQETWGPEASPGNSWALAQLDRLWQGQALKVADEIAALCSQHESVQKAQNYFQSQHSRMAYDLYRAAGYPIGSGTVESGGKNIVQRRLKRPGRGWNRNAAQAMLAGLSELHSNRFNHAWQQFG